MSHALPRALLALALAAAASGCALTRQVKVPVYDQGTVQAYLRSTKVGRKTVARGFSHPAIIASVRLAHALAFVDVEVGEGKKRQRVPAVHPSIIYQVADALEQALEAANPDQEVLVMATRRERRLGIFHTDFLTSFLAYVKGDLLTVQFGHVDWEVPKIEDGRGGGDLPEPKEGEAVMKFRVLPDTAITLLGPQTVALDWKSEKFADPSRIQLSPSGEVRRRTVLMEEAAPDPESAPEGTLPITNLQPATLRALADLEEQRQRGEITEADYQARRREILSGDPATP